MSEADNIPSYKITGLRFIDYYGEVYFEEIKESEKQTRIINSLKDLSKDEEYETTSKNESIITYLGKDNEKICSVRRKFVFCLFCFKN